MLVKRIFSQAQLADFQGSTQFSELRSFIDDLCRASQAQSELKGFVYSDILVLVCDFLVQCKERLAQFTSKHQGRYGNPDFRAWLGDVEASWKASMRPYYPPDNFDEITEYLGNSFGDPQRIDYGTGHELNFVCFLYCHFRASIFDSVDIYSVSNVIFKQYFRLCKTLQRTFLLEPAGSMGVWGLDDYHFLPFMMGAYELTSHKHLRPSSVRNRELLDDLGGEFLYFECVHELTMNEIPLSVRSPLLDDISGAKSWSKVFTGLSRLFLDNVLLNLQVMQHFKFGRLISWHPNASLRHVPLPEAGTTLCECCVKSLPSIYSNRRNNDVIPFD